jgi:hypothetical protein
MTADKTIFGLRLLTKVAGIGPDQPTDLRLLQSALGSFRGAKQGEIKQRICCCGSAKKNAEDDAPPMQQVFGCHRQENFKMMFKPS